MIASLASNYAVAKLGALVDTLADEQDVDQKW
nr:MAG TPA: hypothetical protein [Caudoviricetes sp.]